MSEKRTYDSTETIILWAKQDPKAIIGLAEIIHNQDSESKKLFRLEQYIRMNIPINAKWKSIKKELSEQDN